MVSVSAQSIITSQWVASACLATLVTASVTIR
jgi:hypothetical protein